ncbi:hypothetical protein T211_10195 [Lactococcus lactis subsp. lactis bv. diacetylactis str. LD61]|uniref:Uncharacterized protein n=1 Tax=Lactococcus lactis subsp. cremoris (strain MG1363) TaxID=416870 RepID=A2RJ43_LACLM|nr:hypothetical protein LLNZ_03595 [Lactococcus cremoris subsp. cremoris NZ9000]ESK78695.1 hypothetical protein T211_10195 [Lactococcus lactis subsp. lactis bv. diacetylactis str. LD61]CAL97294.1 hypothetical protein predicted by Glimmer/Critica [Lactococcus cremoris subsp. cremoris MG1363]
MSFSEHFKHFMDEGRLQKVTNGFALLILYRQN